MTNFILRLLAGVILALLAGLIVAALIVVVTSPGIDIGMQASLVTLGIFLFIASGYRSGTFLDQVMNEL